MAFYSSEKSHDASNGAGLVSVLAESGWSVACTTVEEWNQVMESLKGSKHAETKRLLHALQGFIEIYIYCPFPIFHSTFSPLTDAIADFFPEVEHVYNIREKRLKKRLLAEMPRRSSDRIAIKAAVIEEEVLMGTAVLQRGVPHACASPVVLVNWPIWSIFKFNLELII